MGQNKSYLRTLFDSLFGKRAAATDVSLSSAGASGLFKRAVGIFKRRHPRVRVIPLHSVAFDLKHENVRMELANLSVSGMGLLKAGLSRELNEGDQLEGTLICGETGVAAIAEVMHCTPLIIGCQFMGHDSTVHRLVKSYLGLELSALDMISVKTELLQEDVDGTPHWIHGKNNCEVFFISNGAQVLRYNVAFFGNYIEGDQVKPPKYGQVIEDESFGKPRHKGAALIRWDVKLAEEMESYALRFIASVPHLAEEHRKELIRLIKKFPPPFG